MASFYAELTIEGIVYAVRHCHYEFTQATDQRGRVVAKVRHGLVTLTLDVPENNTLLVWASAVYKPLAGHVTFFDAAQHTASETLSWEDGHCIGYREQFGSGATEDGAYLCHLVITAPQLTITVGGPPTPFVAPAPTEPATACIEQNREDLSGKNVLGHMVYGPAVSLVNLNGQMWAGILGTKDKIAADFVYDSEGFIVDYDIHKVPIGTDAEELKSMALDEANMLLSVVGARAGGGALLEQAGSKAAATEVIQGTKVELREFANTTRLLPQQTGPVGEITPNEVIGKTPTQIDARAKQLGLHPRGNDPMNGKGAYIDPITGKQRILSHPNAFPPHGHVNNVNGERINHLGKVVPNEAPDAHLSIKL